MVATVFGLFHPFYHSSGKMLCAKLIRNIESSKRITIMRIWVGNVFNCYENNHFFLYIVLYVLSLQNGNNSEKLWEIVGIVGRGRGGHGAEGELQFGRRECDSEKK